MLASNGLAEAAEALQFGRPCRHEELTRIDATASSELVRERGQQKLLKVT
jgi:hypothetical protein